MLERTVRSVAIVLGVIIALGFILFARDDVDRASDSQVSEIADYELADPTPIGEREREKRHGDVREAIDDANDILLKPFAGISDSADSRWVQRGVPALLGVLVYGVGLGFLARYARGRG